MKEQDKSPETNNKMEISQYLTEFRMMVIKMPTEVRSATHEQWEDLNKEIEHINKYQTEVTGLKNRITELKNSIERFIKY